VAVRPRRVTILVDDPVTGERSLIRPVAADRLQPVGGYARKAQRQGPEIVEPASRWGLLTLYLEIGDHLCAVRQVNRFANGNLLSYDPKHWVDQFGMLADAQINRNRKTGPWGQSEDIHAAEFEEV